MKYNDFEVKIPGATGLQNELQHPSERLLGGAETQPPVIFSDLRGNEWEQHQPTFDYQVFVDGDGNICVPTSILNGAEYYSNYLKSRYLSLANWFADNGYLDEQGSVKYNNCIAAVGSGTNPNAGNTPSRVFDYLKKNGFSPQSARNYDNSWSKARFYQSLTQEEKESGKPWLRMFAFTYYTVPTRVAIWNPTHTPEQLINALKRGVPRVSVDGNYERDPNTGLIRARREEGKLIYVYNHSVSCRGFEYGVRWTIHDHYTNQILDFAWDYPLGNARVPIVTPLGLGVSFAKVENSPEIIMYGVDGKYKNKPLSFQDGDVAKAFFGDYASMNPRLKLKVKPADAKTIIIQ